RFRRSSIDGHLGCEQVATALRWRWHQPLERLSWRLQPVPVEAHVRSLLVVKGEELIQSSEPLAVFLVGLEEPLDLPVRLRSPDFAERVFDVIVVEKVFEFVIETWPIILAGIDEFRSVVGDDLQDRDRTVELLVNAFEEFDGLACRTTVGLDYVEDAPRGVVFDRQHLLSAIVLIPVHVDCNRRILALETNPRPLAALLGWILAHVVVLLENFMDAVVG